MKIVQLINQPVKSINRKIEEGHNIDRHNALYGYDFLIKKGVEVIPVSDYRRTWLSRLVNKSCQKIWKGDAEYYLQLKALYYAHKNNVDLIYCHYMQITPLLASLRKFKILKKPLLVISHDAFSQSTTSIETWKGADRVLTLCERTFDLCKSKENLSVVNCDFIDWGADVDFFDKFHFQQKLKPTNDFIIATGVANRDYNTLVEAMNKISDVNLKIFSSNCNLKIHPKANILIDKNMTRFSAHKLLPQYYNAIATAIPLKEKHDYCTGGTILMESMAMHKAIIVTKSPANLVNVEKEKIGIEVGYNDVNAWHDAILYLKNNPVEAKEMGERAYFLAKKRFNYNRFCDQLYIEVNKFKN